MAIPKVSTELGWETTTEPGCNEVQPFRPECREGALRSLLPWKREMGADLLLGVREAAPR